MVRRERRLLAAGPVALQRFDLRGKGANQLVEGALGAVLLGDVVDVRETAREGHAGLSFRGRGALSASGIGSGSFHAVSRTETN
jgi:hypothetical protein